MAQPVGIQKRNLLRSPFPPRAFFSSATNTTLPAFTEFVFINQAAGSPDGGKNFQSSAIKLSNDGGATIEYSFDGVNVHGRVLVGETSETKDIRRSEYSVFLRTVGGPASWRLEVW